MVSASLRTSHLCSGMNVCACDKFTTSCEGPEKKLPDARGRKNSRVSVSTSGCLKISSKT